MTLLVAVTMTMRMTASSERAIGNPSLWSLAAAWLKVPCGNFKGRSGSLVESLWKHGGPEQRRHRVDGNVLCFGSVHDAWVRTLLVKYLLVVESGMPATSDGGNGMAKNWHTAIQSTVFLCNYWFSSNLLCGNLHHDVHYWHCRLALVGEASLYA